jgi:hypothetical protein
MNPDTAERTASNAACTPEVCPVPDPVATPEPAESHGAILGAILALRLDALEVSADDLVELDPSRRAARAVREVLAGVVPHALSWSMLGDEVAQGRAGHWNAARMSLDAARSLRDDLVEQRDRSDRAESTWRAFLDAPETRAEVERVACAVPEVAVAESLFVVVDPYGAPMGHGPTAGAAWRHAVEVAASGFDAVADVPDDAVAWAAGLVEGFALVQLVGPAALTRGFFREATGRGQL